MSCPVSKGPFGKFPTGKVLEGKYSDGRSPSTDAGAVSKSLFTYAVVSISRERALEGGFGAKIQSAITALITIWIFVPKITFRGFGEGRTYIM